MTGLISRFARDERGVFAVIFAVMAITLIALGGAVVDYIWLEQTRNRGQIALDAAALALQPEIGTLSEEELRTRAEALVRERIGDDRVTANVTGVAVDATTGSLRLTAEMDMPTLFVGLVGVNTLGAAIQSQAVHRTVDVEVSVALDVTGSMLGQRIIDLKAAVGDLVDIIVQDDQSLTYSKVALVPYSQAVNAGSYATALRGPIVGAKNISSISWLTGSTKTITNATRASPVTITASGHGFSNGDWVYIWGVSGMSQINGRAFQVANKTSNTFQLQGVNGTWYSNYWSGGQVRKCSSANCGITITSNGHGYSAGQTIYITGVGGYTALNGNVYDIASATTNTLTISDLPSTGTTSNYTNNSGQMYCTWQTTAYGCQYYRFQNPYGSWRMFAATNCVTERATNGDTDVAPSTTYAGRNYPPSSNPCLDSPIVPLTSDKDVLHDAIDDLEAAGSTSGSLGILWSWYMLSPNFASVWGGDSQPAAYDANDLLKVAIIMTDGEFNTVHCNGAIAQNSTSGSGSVSDQINCNAHNGDAYVQARDYCDAMKADGVDIDVYTIGFGIDEGTTAANLLSYCASSVDKAFLAADGDELRDAFQQIAGTISALHLAR